MFEHRAACLAWSMLLLLGGVADTSVLLAESKRSASGPSIKVTPAAVVFQNYAPDNTYTATVTVLNTVRARFSLFSWFGGDTDESFFVVCVSRLLAESCCDPLEVSAAEFALLQVSLGYSEI
jgi:hypothetical protein